MTDHTQPKKTSGMAIAALVLSFLCFPIGLILGIVALIQISRSNGALGGQVLAIVAVCLSGMALPVVGILAAIAIPNFIRYQLRAKSSEAQMTLSQIRHMQEEFKARHGGYVSARSAPGEPTVQKSAWQITPCPATCGAENLASCNSFACLGMESQEPGYFRYACQSQEKDGVHDVTCVAWSDLDGDGVYGVWAYGTSNATEGGNAVVPVPGPAQCRQEPSSRVTQCVNGEF